MPNAIEDVGSLRGYADHFRDSTVYPDAYTGSIVELMYLGLGIAGEAGEVVDTIKKIARLGEPISDVEEQKLREWQDKLIFELGDLFWYLAQLMRVRGLELDEVLQANVMKLDQRRANNEVKYR